MKWIFSLLLLMIYSSFSAQDYFIKSYFNSAQQVDRMHLQIASENQILVAGHNQESTEKGQVFLRMFDACGRELWSLNIRDTANNLSLIQLHLDSSNNILVHGQVDDYNKSPRPFFCKLNLQGQTIFYKEFISNQNINILPYASAIASNGDYLFYGLHNYSTSPPNNQKIMQARISSQGQLKWAKTYLFNSISWGRMTATSDNGMLAKTSNSVFKSDSLGNIQWAKEYSFLGSLSWPIETDQGYFFFKYSIGALDRAQALMFNKDGSVNWSGSVLYNFFPTNGKVINDGSILFAGHNSLFGNSMGYININPVDGNIMHFKEADGSSTLNGIRPLDIAQDKQGKIYAVAADNRGFIPQLSLIKLDDTLGGITCGFNSLVPSVEQSPVTFTQNLNVNPTTLSDMSLVNRFFVGIRSSNTPGFEECSFSKARGPYRLGNDTLLCLKQFLVLGNPSSDYEEYRWSTGASSKTLFVDKAGIYWLESITPCDTLRDTIQVSFYPEVGLDLGPDTSLCKGESITLKNANSLDNYEWSTGSTNPSITVSDSGWFWLKTNTNCGIVIDSIYVEFVEPGTDLNLGKDSIICQGDPIVLDAGNQSNYLWSTGETSRQIQALDSGLYWVESISPCDTLRDSIYISYHPTSTIDWFISDSLLDYAQKIEVKLISPTSSKTQWNFGDGNILFGDSLSYSYKNSGKYKLSLQVLDSNQCPAFREIIIEVLRGKITAPNVFSPNGDFINDTFGPIGKDFKSYSLSIFDRWGKEVFYSINQAWEGRNKDQEKLERGVYYYIMEIELSDDRPLILKGSVFLSR